MGKNGTKLTTKCTKRQLYTPNGLKIPNGRIIYVPTYSAQDLPKCIKICIFGLKIYTIWQPWCAVVINWVWTIWKDLETDERRRRCIIKPSLLFKTKWKLTLPTALANDGLTKWIWHLNLMLQNELKQFNRRFWSNSLATKKLCMLAILKMSRRCGPALLTLEHGSWDRFPLFM
jgi:hypothetical protein